jgi:phage-related protein
MHIREATQQQEQASKSAGQAAVQAQSRAFAQASAQQQLAAAVRNAAQQHKQALDQVRSAELQVEQAQRSARQAQEDLTRARFEARRALQDMANDLAGARLDERQAVFDLADAEKGLAQLRANPSATQDQIARQQLAVDKAKQQLKEQRLNLQRLTIDEKAASKAGVEGSDQVRGARDRLAEANRRISETERGLAQARANVALGDQQSADQVASARRAMAQANMQAASSTGALGGQMVKLTALERQLQVAWKGLTGAFNTWAKALQPAVLPLLIRGIGLLKSLLPALTPIVIAAANGVGVLLDKLQAGLKSPFFKQFAADLAKWAGPAIIGLGQLVGNLLKAFAGLAQGFAPIGFALLDALNSWVAGFANFTTNLVNNRGFQEFANNAVQIISEIGTHTAAFFAQVGPLFGTLMTALSPVIGALRQVIFSVAQASVPVLGLLAGAFAKILPALAPVITILGQLVVQVIQGLLPSLRPLVTVIGQVAAQVAGAFVQALQQALPSLVQIVTAVGSLIPQLVPLVPLIGQWFMTLLPLVPLIARLAAVIVTALLPVLTLLVKLWVQSYVITLKLLIPVVRLLVTVLTWLAGIAIPIIQAIGVAVRWLGAAAMWLWTNAIKPAFTFIATLAKWLYSIVAFVVIAPLVIQFKVLAAIVTWLWKTIFGPAWRGIVSFHRQAWASIKPVINALGSGIRWVWKTFVEPAFEGMRILVGKLAPHFRNAVDAIRREWDKLKAAAKGPVSFVVNTVFNSGIVKIWDAVAKLVPGMQRLEPIRGFARGGIMPGYAPGKDRLLAAVAPGEAWMRPEWTRAVGPGLIKLWNDIARREGPSGVRRWFTGADAMGGEGINFARGGVVPSFAGAFGLGGIVGKFAKSAKDFFVGGLVKNATRAFNPLLDLADRSVGGTGFGDLSVGVVRGLIGGILKFFKPLENKLGGGKGTGRALAWARSQEGKPYGWGAVGPSAYDCSGFMSAITNVIKGRSPYSRLFTTFSFTGAKDGPQGFVRNLASGFRVGVTNAGVGHMAGTLLGHNVESSGSAGVRVDSGARGANNGLFGLHYGLKFDSGGWLPPGISTVANFTGRPEAVLTDAQLAALIGGASGGSVTEYHGHFDGMTKAAYEAQVRAAFTAMQIAAAQRDRTGRRR